MLRILILVMMLPLTLFGQLIPNNVMPFGSYSCKGADSLSDSLLTYMHEVLGFNQIVSSGFNSTAVQRFYSHQVYPYVWGGSGDTLGDPQIKWAESQYFRCDPELADAFNCTFINQPGITKDIDSGYVYGSRNSSLYGLAFAQPNRYDLIPEPRIQYVPSFRLRISSMGNPDSAVAIYQAYRTYPSPEIIFLDTIKFGEIGNTQWKVINLQNSFDSRNYYFALGVDTSHGEGWIQHTIQISCPCTLYVDYFKVNCPYGANLIDSGQYDAAIIASISRQANRNSIQGWFLKDHERPGNFRPMAHIDSLIRNTTTWDSTVYAAAWLTADGFTDSWAQTYRDFITIVKPRILWTYLYPIMSYSSLYTGYEQLDYPDVYFHTNYLQSLFQVYVTDPADSLRRRLPAGGKWLYTPQTWYKNHNWCGDAPRIATKSETRCMYYLGMCYHPSGIISWLFDWGIDENDCYYEGLIDHNGQLTAPGQAIRDDINPYIKAIESTYMGLTWDTSYTYNPTYGFNAPPLDPIISSINAISITTGDNPDLGWFQVGKYHDNTLRRNKYFMLVNRACSRDSYGNDAHAIAATITFKSPSGARDSAYYVVDIAKTLRNAPDTGWVGTPETTLCNPLNGAISYTTELRAGEGRLFKIVPTKKSHK